MAVITTSSFAKALWPGVNAWYGKAYNDYSTEWDKLFEKNTSKKAYGEDVGTEATTSTLNFQLLGFVQSPKNEVGASARLLARFNVHQYKSVGTTGV